jgi:hypothetical protein
VGAPLEICSKRSVVAVLASGMVISLTALTGGIAPAFAKPDTDPVVTTTMPVPEPKVEVPEEVEAPVQEAPVQQEAPKAPAPQPTAPIVESPPQTQQAVEQPAPAVTQATTEPVITPVAPVSPTTVDNPPVTKTETQAPRLAPPASEAPSKVSAAPSETATAPAQSPASQAPASASASVSASQSASVESVPPSAALVPPNSATADLPSSNTSTATPSSGSATPGGESKASATESTTTASPDGSVSVEQAAKVIEQAEPQTLQAPKEDVQLASNAKPVEVKPDPAAQKDVEEFSSSLGLDLGVKGPFGVEASASANADARLARDRDWDRPIRQWNPDWVRYDEYYRPIICNPYHERVRIIYIYDNRPRIVWINPLSRIVLEVAQFAAYSFTAVVGTAANLVNAAVNTAVNVAVGSFFGGGYFPGIGLPLPPPPPPVLRYDNVPVLVNYSNARYEPFRVRRIVDVGDDARFGERKVLLDGVTPAWGVWTQTASGERQFEVHRTQQFPGLDEPREAPLPGDYQLRLASDESPEGLSARDIFLYVAAGVTVALGFGAIGLALFLGRRRPQH